jgi:flagellar biosynthetic protein FlhB
MIAVAIRVGPPVLVLTAMAIVATLVVQLGLAGRHGRFVIDNIAPKGSRLDPAKGITKIFGMQGWIEVGKGLLKLALLGSITFFWGQSRVAGLMQLTAVGLAGQLAFAWEAVTSLMVQLAAGMIIIALFDWPVQWLRRRRRLRMSLQEVKDEGKERKAAPKPRPPAPPPAPDRHGRDRRGHAPGAIRHHQPHAFFGGADL